MKIVCIHGPNLDKLGQRESEHYGQITLEQLNSEMYRFAREKNLELIVHQSNSEAEIIELIHRIPLDVSALIINPAGFGYSSISIRDAIAILKIPVIEVHLSNIHQRDEFRRHTLISEVCTGQISGLKELGYLVAIQAVIWMEPKKLYAK